MANLLTITKKPHGYYDFVVNGDTVNIVTNDRNDMTGFGNICNFKTANGANIIKQQNITFGNVTLIDGSPLAAPTSMDDLIAKLASIDFYAWRDAGSGSGVDRFDDLADTFDYFGNNGQIPMVDEAQLKLIPYVLPDASYLNNFPTPLVPGKILRVKADNSGYELIDPPAGSSGLKQEFEYVSGTPEFTLGTSAPLTAVAWNGVIMRKSDWTQVLNTLTINFTPEVGAIFTPIGNI